MLPKQQNSFHSKQILYPIAYMIGILGFASVPDTQDYANSWFSLNGIIINFLQVLALALALAILYIHKGSAKNNFTFQAPMHPA